MVYSVSGATGTQNSSEPYGNIQKIGKLKSGRVVYRVINSEGKEAGKLTVPSSDADKFERSYKDIIASAPKIKKYVAENSSEEDLKKRRKKSNYIVASCAALGAAVPIILTRNLKSTTKQILWTIPGIIAGLSAGFPIAMHLTAPPGTMQFAKASKNISKMDIQPYNS